MCLSDNKNTCVECNERTAIARGLCRRCYSRHWANKTIGRKALPLRERVGKTCTACGEYTSFRRKGALCNSCKRTLKSKRCCSCGVVKNADAFCARGGGLLRSSCKECEKARVRAGRKKWAKRAYDAIKERERTARRMSKPQNKLQHRVARALWQKLRNGKGGMASFGAILDYTVNDLKAHLERQFVPGMSWANMGEWHIDHIVPQASFSYGAPSDPDFKACWALPNLRPMWGVENVQKGAIRQYLL